MKIWIDILKKVKREAPEFAIFKSLSQSKVILQDDIIDVYTTALNIEIVNSYLDVFEKVSDRKICFKENVEKNKVDFLLHPDNAFVYETIERFLVSNRKIITLWGNSGVGKTTLINKIVECHKGIYSLANNIVREKNISNFVVIDDLQNIKNKSGCNSQLNKFINSCEKKIIFVLTLDKMDFDGFTKEIKKTIFSHSLIYLPIPSNISVIIQHFVAQNFSDIKFSDKAMDYLVSLLGNDMNFICDKISKIYFFAKNKNSFLVTKDIAQKIIYDFKLFKKEETINSVNNQQLSIICKKFNFKVSEILSSSKTKKIVNNRNLVVYILKKKFNFTHHQISKIINKDHSTITHSIKRIEVQSQNESFNNYLKTLIKEII